MSGPDTIDLNELPKDYFDEQDAFIEKLANRLSKMNVHGTGHSISQTTDNSVRRNDWGPWVTVIGILAGLSIGLSAGALMYSRAVTDEAVKKAQLADNHSDKVSKENVLLGVRVDRLEKLYAEHATK